MSAFDVRESARLMIVRINQFDAPRPESEAGWPTDGPLGPLLTPWPADTRAYEILILDHDEQRRPMAEDFRQQQLRQLIPQAVAAFREPGEEIVVRLDGPLAEREALPAYRHLTDAMGEGRFAVSGAAKLEATPRDTCVSVSIVPTVRALQALCTDGSLGLERSVRFRAFSVPEEMVRVLLEIDSMEDERWPNVLERAGFVLGTVKGMRALQVLTSRFDAAAVKSRLMKRLTSLAQVPANV